MGNATKVALVALLILLVVVIARFVRNDSEDASSIDTATAAANLRQGQPSPGGGTPAAGAKATQRQPGNPAGGSRTVTQDPPPRGGTPRPGATDTGATTRPPVAGGQRPPGAAAPSAGSTGAPGARPGDTATTPSLAAGEGTKFVPLPLPKPITSGEFSGRDPAGTGIAGGPGSRPGAGTSGTGTAGGAPAGDPRGALPPGESRMSGSSPLRQPPGIVSPGERAGQVPLLGGTKLEDAPALAGVVVPPDQAGNPFRGGGSTAEAEKRSLVPGSGSAPGTTDPRTGSPPGGSHLKGAGVPPPAVDPAGKLGTEARPPAGAAAGSFPQTYIVQPADSFWRIADKVYGKGSLAEYLEKANPGVKMQPGEKLSIPAPPADTGTRAAPNPPSGGAGGTDAGAKSGIVDAGPGYRIYQVGKGETFWSIAKKLYGDPLKYTRLEEANPQHKSGLIAGAKIKVPDPAER